VSRIRVLVVDDSVVARRMVTDAIQRDHQIEVVGVAANGRIALAMVEQLAPDLVMMDVEMPVMDGVEAVRALRRRGDRMPIIVFTAMSSRDAKSTFNALAAGATDFVTKPSSMSGSSASLARVAEQLIPKIKALVPDAGSAAKPPGTRGAVGQVGRGADAIHLAARPAGSWRPVRAVVIGASMGGPQALSLVLRKMTRLPVPIALVQHMPAVFSRQFAERLDTVCGSTVLEVAGGEELEPGHVYVAPGDHHLELEATARGACTVLRGGPQVNFSRPSVDTLFRSAVEVYGGDLLAVVLTGMGADGRGGCGAVVAAGGMVLAQDEASSLAWGMPGAVVKAGFAHRVLPLDEIGAAIYATIQGSQSVGIAASEGAQ
jgi:two-component system, chemotaxis family, protein-glutamate methylesterase/glutaminase